MLSISAMTGTGLGNYYLNLAREDYYLGGGEPPGQWFGKGAEGLHLEGKVERQALRNLLLGRTPDGKRDLVQNAGKESRQSGWDLTFSAPKSVSTLFATSADDVRARIRAAQAKAVAEALTFLETRAAFTRRGSSGKEREAVGLVAAAFEHATSRRLEPQLHTHLLVINACIRADGTSGTILSKPLYQLKMAAGAVYRRALARELKALGLQLVMKKGDQFEIAGIPRILVNTWSTRRAEIKKALAERGLNSAVAAKVAALDTRPKKRFVARHDLFISWEKVARRHGFTREMATALFRDPSRERERQAIESKAANTAGDTPRNSSGGVNPQKNIIQMEQFESKSRQQRRTEDHQRTRETGQSGQQTAKDQSRKPKRDQGRVLFRIPVVGVPVRVVKEQLFPKAPSWSPAKHIKVSRLVVGHAKSQVPTKRREEVVRKKALGPLELQVRERPLFPNAPSWSPAAKWKTKSVAVRPRVRDFKSEGAEQRRQASQKTQKRDTSKGKSQERSR